jgi:hypothetical protein
MVEKGNGKKEMEKIVNRFEKRQDEKLKALEDRVVHQFHVVSEGLMDHVKLLAEGHAGILNRLDQMENENERQHLETRSLIKLSFAELDRRVSDLESQMKEMKEWKRQVESRFQI